MSDLIPFRRHPAQKKIGHTCICGATWRPGFSSDPAWLITADRRLGSFIGLLHCQACGRDKMDVFREQAEQRRAATPPAIPPRERPAAPVLPFRRPSTSRRAEKTGE